MTATELIAYLEAKALLDRRSLNRQVFEAFCALLAEFGATEVLDLGSGTGAMLRILAQAAPTSKLWLSGVEKEAALVEAAAGLCQRALAAEGWQTTPAEGGFEARQGERWRRVRFICADGLAFSTAEPLSAVCAHTFMDLVPLAKTLARIHSFLAPGGLFYASCNYDGSTTLFPQASDPAFEAELLARYDRSMEARRVAGEPTGGAQCGRRLVQALLSAGWEIVSYGSSDWNLTPVRGSYRDQDAQVLEALLGMIYREGQGLDPKALASWHQERLKQLRAGQLGLIVHQLDVLAARP